MTTAAGLDRYALVAAPQTPGAGGTVTPDLSQGRLWTIQMPAGNIKLLNPLNGLSGDVLCLIITQDAIGARIITWGNAYKRMTVPLSITANARDAVTFTYDGTTWYQTGSVLALT
jgi:hypothetical protein